MYDVYDLADDLADVIVEYQVSTSVEKYSLYGPLMWPAVLAAEGDLRSELHIDCKSSPHVSVYRRVLINPYRTQVRHSSALC